MSGRRSSAALWLLSTVLLAGGCGGVVGPSQNVVENMSGTLAVNGRSDHEFRVSKNGEFEVKITQLAPNADAILGLQYGPLQNGQCGIIGNNFARLNQVALGGFINSGNYCLIVSDVGSLTQPATYTLRVSHP
jgi:hypothetical protein